MRLSVGVPSEVTISIDKDEEGDIEIAANGVVIGWVLANTGMLRLCEWNSTELQSMGFQVESDGRIKVSE